ncbi:MAG TPA: HPr family phosphocarrier protein, partial [Candidatus Alectryocaccobium stercorigallinarum]|nr:HPr family phosphocarrier protein [Candidatus Alectryocaccobium stercorigallinarum]
LGLDAGEEVIVSTNGSDEEVAMEKIENYLLKK